MGKLNYDAGMPIGITLDPGTYYRCTCGESESLPFCDGTHTGGNACPVEFHLSERRKVYLCSCGKSTHAPFCDGECGADLTRLK